MKMPNEPPHRCTPFCNIQVIGVLQFRKLVSILGVTLLWGQVQDCTDREKYKLKVVQVLETAGWVIGND